MESFGWIFRWLTHNTIQQCATELYEHVITTIWRGNTGRRDKASEIRTGIGSLRGGLCALGGGGLGDLRGGGLLLGRSLFALLCPRALHTLPLDLHMEDRCTGARVTERLARIWTHVFAAVILGGGGAQIEVAAEALLLLAVQLLLRANPVSHALT